MSPMKNEEPHPSRKDHLRELGRAVVDNPTISVSVGILQFLLVVSFSESKLFHTFTPLEGWTIPSHAIPLAASTGAALCLGLRCLTGRQTAILSIGTRPLFALLGLGALLSASSMTIGIALPLPTAIAFLVLGSLLLALGLTVSTVRICVVLSKTGARLTLLYGAIGTLANTALIALFHNCDIIAQGLLLTILSMALAPLLKRAHRGKPSATGTEPNEPVQVPWRLTITAFFQGFSFTAIYFTYPLALATGYTFALDMAGFVLAAACLAIAVARFNVNYNRLLYQICFPTIALSYLLLLLDGPFPEVALVVKNAGYTVLDIAIIALSAYLVRERKAPAALVALWPSFALLLGHFVSSGMVAACDNLEVPGWKLDAVVACIMLCAALWLSSGRNMRTGWGIARAGGESAVSQPRSLTCELLAANHNLTKREQEILELLSVGKNKSSIAAQLFISVDTAKTHIARVYRKLGIHSQQELILLVDKASRELE